MLQLFAGAVRVTTGGVEKVLSVRGAACEGAAYDRDPSVKQIFIEAGQREGSSSAWCP